MDDLKRISEKIKQKQDELEMFSSGSNRILYGLVDKTKHYFMLAVATQLREQIVNLEINNSDKAKLLSARSDLITLEYSLVIVDRVFPGLKEKVKKKLFDKLNDDSKHKLYTKDVGPNLAHKVISADIFVKLCEEQGINDLSDVFSNEKGTLLLLK